MIDSTVWTIIGILPIAMFFILFAIFGGFMRVETSSKPKEKPDINIQTGEYIVNKNKSFVGDNTNNMIKRILLNIGLAKKND